MSQIDLFSKDRKSKAIPQVPNPDDIRIRLNAVLDQVRASKQLPWTPAQLRSWKHVFENMANWLPPEERDGLRRAFLSEVERLQ